MNTDKTEPLPRVSRTLSMRGIAIWGISVTLFSFFIFRCTGFIWNSFERAQPRGHGMLNEAGSDLRVQDSVGLVGEDWVQSVGARLDRLCPRRDFHFERTQKGSTLIQLERREDFHVFCKGSAESVDSTRVPTGGVQREIYPVDAGGNNVPEAKKRFVLT